MFVPFAEMSSEHSARRRCAAAGWSCPDNRPNSPTNCHAVTVENVEDEIFVTVNHPMTKEHYISFLAYVTHDRFETAKLYPEGAPSARFRKRGRGKLYFFCNRHGLMSINV